jgi:hypothetical protein
LLRRQVERCVVQIAGSPIPLGIHQAPPRVSSRYSQAWARLQSRWAVPIDTLSTCATSLRGRPPKKRSSTRGVGEENGRHRLSCLLVPWQRSPPAAALSLRCRAQAKKQLQALHLIHGFPTESLRQDLSLSAAVQADNETELSMTLAGLLNNRAVEPDGTLRDTILLLFVDAAERESYKSRSPIWNRSVAARLRSRN